MSEIESEIEKSHRGVGLDMGTMNIVAARRTSAGIVTNRIRDAFHVLPRESRKMLKLSGVNYIEKEDDLIVVGDAAYDMANMMSEEVRRPLQSGLISAGEVNALEILGILVRHVLKDPQEENEICYFSVPAAPVDDPTRDVIYHRGILENIVRECGYKPFASNEALAIVYSECASDGFSGLTFSYGSGMTNIALAINTIEGLSFSIGRGGDWIDAGAAKSTGSTQARMCTLKEKGLNLMNPEGREQEALTVYYKNLIEYGLDHVMREFIKIKDRFALPKPIPIIVSGGTSMVDGFLDFFNEVFDKKKKKFPFEISEIRAAKEPLDSVARGLLIQALQEYEDED